MRITAIDTFKMTAGWRNWLFVKVTTDAGIHGWGEGSMEGRERSVEAAIVEMTRGLLGEDPRRVEAHWQRGFRDGYWRVGPVMTSAIGALDMAFWDIKGKALGAPVYELLGGAVRDEVAYYGNGWYAGASTPDEFADAATRAVAGGARALKLDPFWPGDLWPERSLLEGAESIVARTREAVGADVELMIEVHGRFGPTAAIEAARMLEPHRPYWFEEPVPPDNVEAMHKVASGVRISVATGERLYTKWGFRELIERQAAAIIQPDHIHTGGITEGKKIAAMAEVYYIPVAPHNASGPVLTACNLQLDAALPNFLIQELFTPDMALYDELLIAPIVDMTDGRLRVPVRPGHGADFDEDALRRRVADYDPDVEDLGMLFRPMHTGTIRPPQ